MDAITGLFSTFGLSGQSKFLILDRPAWLGAFLSQASSLKISEHVSPAGLMRQEISRHPSAPTRPAGDATLALMRRWFFARKPDAGFVLTDFPATLLQAIVFDEWLEARGESLTGVLSAAPGHPAAEHYRTLGILTVIPAKAVVRGPADRSDSA